MANGWPADGRRAAGAFEALWSRVGCWGTSASIGVADVAGSANRLKAGT
ncbi:MAG: hypothetical protein AAB536_02390 [Patescibacteria group bacterium]